MSRSIRTNSTLVLAVWGALLVGGLVGCDDGDVSIRVQKCQTICERYEMCDDATDVPGCEERCSAEDFRSDTYFEVKAGCVETLSCNRLADGDASSELEDCLRRALRDERPSSRVEDLCRGLANKMSDCDDSQEQESLRASCERVAVTLSEAYLDGSEDCALERCSNVELCYQDLADAYDTNVRVF
jgi:hypothetical protein